MATNTGAMPKPLVFQIRILVEPDDTGFHAWIPTLKGFHASGSTSEQARKLACELAVDYLETLIEDGDPIPVGPQIEPNGESEIPSGAKAFLEQVTLFSQ